MAHGGRGRACDSLDWKLVDGHEHVRLSPEGLRRKAGAFDKRAQLGPGKIGMDPAAKSAIRVSNDVFAAYDRGIAKDAVGDELRVFDKVGGMADDARH